MVSLQVVLSFHIMRLWHLFVPQDQHSLFCSLSLFSSVVHEPARGTPGLEGSSLSGTWTRGLEPGSSRQESAKNAPRGSSLESSPLVDPCSSRQEAACQETRVRSSRVQTGLEPARARGTPGLEGLESARLVHNTTLFSLSHSFIFLLSSQKSLGHPLPLILT